MTIHRTPAVLGCRLQRLSRGFCSRRPTIIDRRITHVFVVSSYRQYASKTSVVDISDLPQGLIPGEPLPPIDEQPSGYPTVIQQALNNMRRLDRCIVLTRVGSFYEMYFEQAEEIGMLLGLKIASKRANVGRVPTRVPMAGFPYFQLEKYLKILVQEHGKHVALVEEVANDPSQKVKSGGLMFDRQLRRIITPGTLIDEHFLTPYEHNYLLAVKPGLVKDQSDQDPQKPAIGLAWLDLSSGSFFTQSTDLDSLSSAIARIRPREIIIERYPDHLESPLMKLITQEEGRVLTMIEPRDEAISANKWHAILGDEIQRSSVEQYPVEEVLAANILLQHTQDQLPGLKFKLQAPIRQPAEDFMKIDRNSLRGLEILQTLRDGLFKGSLLHAVRRTATESGARLLAQRLTAPSMSMTIIDERLDLVESMLRDAALREEAFALLRQTSDTLRLVQRFSLGRGDAGDLLGLSRTIIITKGVADLFQRQAGSDETIQKLLDKFTWDGPLQMAEKIFEAIDEEGLSLQQREQELEEAGAVTMAREVIEEDATVSEQDDALMKRLSSRKLSKWAEASNGRPSNSNEEIWIMRREASETLSYLHAELEGLNEEREQLAASLRDQLNATSLSLKWTPGLGHIVHVKGKDTKVSLTSLESARTVSSSKSTRSFYLPSWTSLGNRIEDTKLRIRAEEVQIFQALRNLVITNLVKLRRNAAVLDDIDVAASSASLAAEHNLVRPQLHHGRELLIHGGRHLTVESNLRADGRAFTPNDCTLDDTSRTWLITGPNMAGKSTFLRQTALISVLAQTGLFVPATHARLGLVDAVFSRVGSADNLSRDQSTFMVEMLETAHILRHATPRSLVVMDEVGRGTTPEDGVAVGYAVLKHLVERTDCRLLFATHFHRLADMTATWPGVATWCTAVRDDSSGASFWFDRKLRPGVNRHSHALKVALLADMPSIVIDDARRVLAQDSKVDEK